MAIYGTALLAACLIVGVFLGKCLGNLLGIDTDLGGVGIAMLLLIGSTEYLRKQGYFTEQMSLGITYWTTIYVPIVVAVSATQNVRGALSSSIVPIVSGILAVVGSFAILGWLNRGTRS